MSEAADRLYPPRPILCVSAAVFRDRRALVARRGRAPHEGLFSLPGGIVEIGESLEDAALRELREEVGVEADIVGFTGFLQPIERADGRVRSHYCIASFVALWRAGEPTTGPEATECRWIEPAEADGLPTTPGLAALLRKAEGLVRALP